PAKVFPAQCYRSCVANCSKTHCLFSVIQCRAAGRSDSPGFTATLAGSCLPLKRVSASISPPKHSNAMPHQTFMFTPSECSSYIAFPCVAAPYPISKIPNKVNSNPIGIRISNPIVPPSSLASSALLPENQVQSQEQHQHNH